MSSLREELYDCDALLIADIQNDFLPGGALGVKGGDEIVPVLRGYIDRFQSRGLPIFLSQDWHPPTIVPFESRAGPGQSIAWLGRPARCRLLVGRNALPENPIHITLGGEVSTSETPNAR